MVAPVLLEHRPEHLVEVIAAAADRTTQHAFLRGAKFAECAVRAAVLQQHARFESMRPKRAERERADQARSFQEDAAAARRWRERAFPFSGFKTGIELPHLQKSDDGARGRERDDVGERESRRALA